MFLLKPGALSNNEKRIRDEIQRLGKALILAAQSPRDYRLGKAFRQVSPSHLEFRSRLRAVFLFHHLLITKKLRVWNPQLPLRRLHVS